MRCDLLEHLTLFNIESTFYGYEPNFFEVSNSNSVLDESQTIWFFQTDEPNQLYSNSISGLQFHMWIITLTGTMTIVQNMRPSSSTINILDVKTPLFYGKSIIIKVR